MELVSMSRENSTDPFASMLTGETEMESMERRAVCCRNTVKKKNNFMGRILYHVAACNNKVHCAIFTTVQRMEKIGEARHMDKRHTLNEFGTKIIVQKL